MTLTIDTLSRIATQNAQLLAPALGLVLFLVAQHYLGRWPDLWRARRLVLPVLDRLADGDYDDEIEAVERYTAIDVSAAADALPEKTGLRLNARTLVGTIDAPPSEVRAELRGMSRVYPNTLASIQYDIDEEIGERVWEVGSYAYRPEGFLGMWSTTSGSRRRETGERRAFGATTNGARGGRRSGTTVARVGMRTAACGRSPRCSRAMSDSRQATERPCFSVADETLPVNSILFYAGTRS